MHYSDTTDLQGIIQEQEALVFGSNYGAISGNTTLLKEFTRYNNRALDSISGLILASDTRWQWDDSNYTDLPIGQTDLIDGQQIYVLDTDHIKILSVEAKDASGNFYPLKPIDLQDLKTRGIAPTEFFEENGQPQYYDALGDTVQVYPAPASANVTLSNGLKVHYQRKGDYFAYTDTTKEAGFPSIFDFIITLKGSLMYCLANQMNEKARNIAELIKAEEKNLQEFMSKRDKSDRPRLTVRTINAR